ncbi:hypothetical protein F5Y10DRAFT_229974 [Nemania abortiva]|nr:hypothetical protein F5Y10DRAFT_229974 [Nemania abortiva]
MKYIASQIRAINQKIDMILFFHGVPLGVGDGHYFPLMPSFEPRPASDDDFETNFNNGRLTMARKSSGPLRTPDAALVQIETGESFCNACLNALGYLARYLEQTISVPDRYEMSDRLPPNVVLHWNILALMDSRMDGCHLCTLISAHVPPRASQMMQHLRVELVLYSEKGSELRAEDTRLACALTPSSETERTSDNYRGLFKLRLWPSPKNDNIFPRQAPSGDCRLPSLLESSPRGKNTRSAKRMAIEWLDRCKNNHGGIHGACAAEDSSWLPTRLLDLSNAGPGGMVTVVCPGKRTELFTTQKTPYITLSHSWGNWQEAGLPRLLDENKDQYGQDGIRFDDLPLLFRDAIEIARWFEVRWLWIDSLCIIQNSPGMSDWAHEALLMCKVYKFGLLNISADDSYDARDGCFRDRLEAVVTPFKLRMANLERSWWVAMDERDVFDWVSAAPLSQRAWVFQERQLTRRALHFTKHEVFWECSAADPYCACETFPEGSPFSIRFLRMNKYEPSALLSGHDRNSKLRVWLSICEDFSAKALTFERDRLPALAGLASEFAPLFPRDRYVVGFWSSTLPEALLWSTEHTKRKPGLRDVYVAPTWSWLSSDSSVSFRVIPRSDHKLPCKVAEVRAIHVTPCSPSPFGTVQTDACIDLEGILRSIRVVQTRLPSDPTKWYNPDSTRKYQLFVDGRDWGKVYAMGDISYHPDNPGESVGKNSNDSQDKTVGESTEWSGYCFPVAVSRHSDHLRSRLVLEGLLLHKIDSQNVFKRVGMIGSYDEGALPVIYQLGDEVSEDEVRMVNRKIPILDPQINKRPVRQSDRPTEGSIEGHTDSSDEENKQESSSRNDAGPIGLYDIYQVRAESSFQKLSSSVIRII